MRKGGDAALVALALADLFPVVGDLEEQVDVDARVVLGLLERRGDHLDRGLGVAERERRGRGVDDGGTGLGGLDVVGGRHAADVMAVDVHRQADLVVEGLDETLGAVRREHAGHVLDGDRLGAELLELQRVLDVAVERVHGAQGVGDGALEVTAALVDRLGTVLDVADVVERVEDAEDVDAVALGGLDEVVDDVF